ncbi:MAG: inverse autotransporter beta domain-containing protein [Veillonella dispar]|uniref:inverse autotransporter beta domain-containing protein n=1 Tax=Veillonella dispar TaxID=39778 RepID=UPI00280B4440|nr:inverse autotransporter beta domain-containing protein [Veillonella dispar]MDU4886132.1 inverse autotransporter beta domain-containing protein [Veillonella dispar]
MSKTLMIKAMVLGAVACAFSAAGFAADVQNGHGQGIADSTTEVNEAKHDAVRSSWMDRTDIVVGVGMKNSEESSSHHFHNFTPWENHPIVGTSDKSKSTELNKLYIETLQPITHYDENAKSVVFVQGRIGRSGEKISSNKLNNYWVPARPAGTFTVYNGQTDKEESLGVNANVGVGYRRLSKGEHAYVGINTFYDHAFKNGYKRVSGGLEYVVGLNEFHANIYKNLGSNERKYIGLYGRTSTWYDPTGLYPYGRDDDTSLYNYATVDYENHWMLSEKVAASGFDVGYSRTFKNARWARVYADYYNWRGRAAVKVGYYKLNKREDIKGFKVGAEFHITPHLTLDAGYKTASHHLSGPYATLKYTIGTSKFAWHGGKHSESAITTARSKMLDKVHRSDMVVLETVEENYDHGVVDVGL